MNWGGEGGYLWVKRAKKNKTGVGGKRGCESSDKASRDHVRKISSLHASRVLLLGKRETTKEGNEKKSPNNQGKIGTHILMVAGILKKKKRKER